MVRLPVERLGEGIVQSVSPRDLRPQPPVLFLQGGDAVAGEIPRDLRLVGVVLRFGEQAVVGTDNAKKLAGERQSSGRRFDVYDPPERMTSRGVDVAGGPRQGVSPFVSHVAIIAQETA